MDWRRLIPIQDSDAESLLAMAQQAVRETIGVAADGAVVSHVGFRSTQMDDWDALQNALQPYGETHMTFKETDGRKIPFVKLHTPLVIGTQELAYIELPEPKHNQVDEPSMLVVYQTAEASAPHIQNHYDIRQQVKHARDFIERDKGR